MASGCTTFSDTVPENFDAQALLHATERGFFEFRTTKLFAVDGRRTRGRDWVALNPGPHDIEIAIGHFDVRRLRFEARAGVEYEVDHSGYWFDDDLVYWIAERDSGARVAIGDDSMGEAVFRQWYIDDFRGEFGGVATGDGTATFLDYSERLITIAGVHDAPEFPARRPPHWEVSYPFRAVEVPAGTWVVEIHLRRGKQPGLYGRLVFDFKESNTYRLEQTHKSWWSPFVSGAWLVDGDTGERIAEFHTCIGSGVSFTMCEPSRYAETHYAGIEPGDPRFWWGSDGISP